jgi:PH/SEC7 domain-containing protein
MNMFDFSGLRLDHAFRYEVIPMAKKDHGLICFCRHLCAKLFLKAETQQVDRILEEFSRRYWDNNPGGLYGSVSKSTFSLAVVLFDSQSTG